MTAPALPLGIPTLAPWPNSRGPVFNVADSIYGAQAVGIVDVSVSINAAITAMRLTRNATIYVPAGRYTCLTPLNLTLLNERGMTLQGDGASQLGTVGGTCFLANVGNGKPFIDTTGSNYYQFRDFTIYCAASGGTSVGILQARTAGFVGVAEFNERWVISNVNVIMEPNAGASARGTIGVYNCCAEDGCYESMWVQADAPFQVRATNGTIGFVSPFLGALSGPASMTSVQWRSCLSGAYTYSAIEFEDAHNIDCQMVTVPLNGNPQPAYNFNGTCSSIRMVGGQDDQSSGPWIAIANFNGSASFITFDKTCTNVIGGGGLILLQAGVTLANSVIRLNQLNGTLQPLFACAGANKVSASELHVGAGQRIGGAPGNLTLESCSIYSKGAAAVVNVATASTYTVYDETGIRTNGAGCNIRAIAASTTAAIGDDTLLVTTTGGVVNLVLPTTCIIGKVYTVKLVAGANNIVLTGASGTVDGAANKTWNTLNATFRFQFDGTNYFIV